MTAAAALLVLAALFDSAVPAIIGAFCVVGVFVAREAWTWRGARRQWLLMIGLVAGLAAAAYLVQRLS